MPTISQKLTKRGVRYKAQVRKQGVIETRTFPTEVEARSWANSVESRIENFKYRPSVKDREADLAPLLGILPGRVLRALSSIPYTLRELLDAAIPVNGGPGVYLLIHKHDVVYVGQSSVDCISRVSKHRRDGKDFDSYVIIPCDRDRLDSLEEQYITAFVPKLNQSLGKRQHSATVPDCPETVHKSTVSKEEMVPRKGD